MDSKYLDSIEKEVDAGRDVMIYFSLCEEEIPSTELVENDLDPGCDPYFLLPSYYDYLEILYILTKYFRSYKWYIEYELESDSYRIYGYDNREEVLEKKEAKDEKVI